MPIAHVNGMEIVYETSGPDDGPAVLMVMGLAGQLTFWPDPLVKSLNDAGFRTIRFDNRDIGKSQKMHNKRPPNLLLQMGIQQLGIRGLAPYNLAHMAQDTISLLDGLGISQAHIMGVSMGGIISQIAAAENPDRIKSFTAIMSTTNNRKLPAASPEIAKYLFRPGKPPANREAAIERSFKAWGLIGTKNSGSTPEELRSRIEASYDRSYSPEGARRQVSAIVETGDVRKWTRRISSPALVIHGADDPLVPVQGGMDIAQNIPGARLEIIEGMGHDLPKKHLSRISKLLVEHFRSAETSASNTRAAE